MPTLQFKYMKELVGTYIDAPPLITFDGRFVAGTSGFFIDLWFNKLSGQIRVPSLPIGFTPLNLIRNAPYYINLETQEILLLSMNIAANVFYFSLYDFNGNPKTSFYNLNSAGYGHQPIGCGWVNGNFYVVAGRVTSLQYSDILKLDFSLANPIIPYYEIVVYSPAYTITFAFKGGLLVLFPPPSGPAVSYQIGTPSDFVNNYYKNEIAARGFSSGVFKGFFAMSYYYYSNSVLDSNGLVIPNPEGYGTILRYGNLNFSMKFDAAYAGSSITAIFFVQGLPFVLIDYHIFSAVWISRFDHNFADNFARGVPIAGFKRA